MRVHSLKAVAIVAALFAFAPAYAGYDHLGWQPGLSDKEMIEVIGSLRASLKFPDTLVIHDFHLFSGIDKDGVTPVHLVCGRFFAKIDGKEYSRSIRFALTVGGPKWTSDHTFYALIEDSAVRVCHGENP